MDLNPEKLTSILREVNANHDGFEALTGLHLFMEEVRQHVDVKDWRQVIDTIAEIPTEEVVKFDNMLGQLLTLLYAMKSVTSAVLSEDDDASEVLYVQFVDPEMRH